MRRYLPSRSLNAFTWKFFWTVERHLYDTFTQMKLLPRFAQSNTSKAFGKIFPSQYTATDISFQRSIWLHVSVSKIPYFQSCSVALPQSDTLVCSSSDRLSYHMQVFLLSLFVMPQTAVFCHPSFLFLASLPLLIITGLAACPARDIHRSLLFMEKQIIM